MLPHPYCIPSAPSAVAVSMLACLVGLAANPLRGEEPRHNAWRLLRPHLRHSPSLQQSSTIARHRFTRRRNRHDGSLRPEPHMSTRDKDIRERWTPLSFPRRRRIMKVLGTSLRSLPHAGQHTSTLLPTTKITIEPPRKPPHKIMTRSAQPSKRKRAL